MRRISVALDETTHEAERGWFMYAKIATTFDKLKSGPRRQFLPLLAVTLGALAACGGSDSNVSANPNNLLAIGEAEPQIEAQVFQDLESVSFAALTPFDESLLDSEGLRSTVLDAELDCELGWQTSKITFGPDQQSLQSQLCDGTNLQARYTIDSGVIVLSNLLFDGEQLPGKQYEMWGLLPVAGEENRWRACYYSIEGTADPLRDGQQSLPDAAWVPAAENLKFDCSADAYLFFSDEAADEFLAMNPSL
ncbi:MAG: hypothetical protein EX270_03340 [Pseudomonadales bacterium]|nr:MAG: hypothetical protein EX270_03340 [Pseudomonadales bacterium]